MNKTILAIFVTAAASLALGFGSGALYQKSRRPSFGREMGSVQGVVSNRQTGKGSFQTKNGFQRGGVPISGKIVKIEDKTLTLETQNAGNKIIYLADSTLVNKTASTNKSEMKVGDEIMIIGNQDTSGANITAQTINILASPKQ